MKVKNQIMWLVLSCVFGLSLFFLFFFQQSTRMTLREDLSREVERMREGLVRLWKREEERLLSQLEDYARWTDMGEKAVRERDQEWIGENLEPWVREQFGYEVILFTEEGETVAVSPGWVVPVSDIPMFPWVGAYGNGETVFLFAFQPVRDNAGEVSYGPFLALLDPFMRIFLPSGPGRWEFDWIIGFPGERFWGNRRLRLSRAFGMKRGH